MPTIKNTPNFLLFIGDMLLLSVSLYATLLLRYGEVPAGELLANHFTAFSALFIVSALIFFVAGLYDRKTLLFPDSLWQRILETQAINSLIAVVFFYAIPFFSIAPKTNLFIYIVVSSALLVVWRYWATSLLEARAPSRAILIGGGPLVAELKEQIKKGRYGLEIETQLDPDAYTPEELYVTTRQIINSYEISFVILDRHNETVQAALPRLHSFLYASLHFLSVDTLYEAVFDRVPIERLGHEWFIEHIHQSPHAAYDALKRGMDIIIALFLGLLSLPFYPLVFLLVAGSGEGSLFSKQERVGQYDELFIIYKFRTMLFSNKTVAEGNRVTRVGKLLRKLRIDELPQILNVLKGDLSFIGPRPETPALVSVYEKEIPFHNTRELIKPGLSGWAQLKQKNPPKFAANTEKAREKLSYDLYYVKNRSLMLDLKIALQTLRVLASRSGR
jgi:lipopolysaccharide/colanic/teichoic acid biosynthesis glycosyltransferase